MFSMISNDQMDQKMYIGFSRILNTIVMRDRSIPLLLRLNAHFIILKPIFEVWSLTDPCNNIIHSTDAIFTC